MIDRGTAQDCGIRYYLVPGEYQPQDYQRVVRQVSRSRPELEGGPWVEDPTSLAQLCFPPNKETAEFSRSQS